jgi:16S rRNA (uracil1498-N3)-methyltransferase
MRLRRLYLARGFDGAARLPLEPAAARHLTRVLRMRGGDALNVFDGAGRERRARIASARGEAVELELGEPLAVTPESPLAITLAQGVSRSERMDYAIQKATELGVKRIVPLMTQRSVVKLDASKATARLEHWRAVAISACEQCGRATLPEIEPPRPLAEYLAVRAGGAAPTALRLVLLPGAATGPAALPAPLAAVELLVGPEGGLEDEESALALGAGFRGLRLGPRILRTETAAAAAIAALQVLRGDLA